MDQRIFHFQHTGIGKLVGMPVPGTMSSVSWETLQDPSLVYGMPIIGYRLPDGSYLVRVGYKTSQVIDMLLNT